MEKRRLPEWMQERAAARNFRKESQDPAERKVNEKKPLVTFKGKLRYLYTVHDCCCVCEAILKKLETLEELIVGFDLEWPVDFRRGRGQGRTALIQFCPSQAVCYLFHVIEWNKLPKVFVNFISHPKVKLVGVNIRGDIWKLGRDFDISVAPIVENNAVELRHLANKVFSITDCWSLDRLVVYVLKKQLAKPEDVRLSNWAQIPLTNSQFEYAANDAYASLIVYNRLKELEVEFNVKKGNVATDECLGPGPDELQGCPHYSNPDS
ncbi:Werner Syndrome-like exonuclease isoform X2 [Homalodisca vitripennis]|uniref:Werner Syndrome-like exonuclease isoform X2 n=1 Tax=Homalodisca vitripennis TaxID=197043 RepID=UPI001EEC1C24|nr:Werner Syndrome-like exonuclease isoform X2 [Homalodisca vitripennis]